MKIFNHIRLSRFHTFTTSPSRGGVMIVVIVFIIVSAVMAHKLAINPETAVKSSREDQLRSYVAQYNMALLRYHLSEKKWPGTLGELSSKPGFLRELTPDPFTKKTDYLLAEINGQKYVTSASAELSAAGKPYNTLTVNAARKFVSLAQDSTPPLAELMGYKSDLK